MMPTAFCSKPKDSKSTFKQGGVVMKKNSRWLGLIALVLLCISTSACISIEQEIFVKADGSGDLLLHISLPDLPEDSKALTMGSGADTGNVMEKFKKEVIEKLPPTIKLVEAKSQKRNGTAGFYALFRFQNLSEVQALMGQILQESTKEMPGGDPAQKKSKPPEWTLAFDKQNGVTNFTQTFFADMSDAKVETKAEAKAEVKTETTTPEVVPVEDPPPAVAAAPTTRRTTKRQTRSTRRQNNTPKIVAPREEPPEKPEVKPEVKAEANAEFKMEGLEKMASMIFSAIKFRFVLHTPTPIKDSNADIVLNGNIALWDCSLAAFANDPKPIVMKVSF
jgi:hypothetical protein